MTKLRFFAFIAVLVVAASIAAASAQTQTGEGTTARVRPTSSSHTRNGSHPACRTWSASSEATSSASSEGRSYERTVSGNFVHLDAIYIVIAPDPASSFTAHVEGTEDLTTLKAVLDGRVVDGFMKRAHVHVKFDVITLHTGAERHLLPGHDQRSEALDMTRSSKREETRARCRRARYT